MPVYTAVIDFKREGVFQEQVWLEEIHAENTRLANNKACVKAGQYLKNQKGEPGAPNGFELVMCIRTEMLDKKRKSDLMIPLAPALPAPKKDTSKDSKGVTIRAAKVITKFDDSCLQDGLKGDFIDPYGFKEELLVRSGVTAWRGNYSPNGRMW